MARRKYDPKAPRLAFTKPLPGPCSGALTTVRLGPKWVQKFIEDPELCAVALGADGKPVGCVRIDCVRYLALREVPDMALRLNYYGPVTYPELFRELREVYPSDDVHGELMVSVVEFQVV